MGEPLTTRILGERAQQGDRDALNELFQRDYPRVLKDVRKELGAKLRKKMELSDVIQQVMLKVFPKVARINFSSEGAFMQYLKKVVLNEIRDEADHWAAKKRDLGKEVPLENNRSLGSENPLDALGTPSGARPSRIVSRQEEFALLKRAMDRLAEQSQEDHDLIVAVQSKGRTYGEIGDEIGKSPDAVRMQFNRARAELAKIYRHLEKAR